MNSNTATEASPQREFHDLDEAYRFALQRHEAGAPGEAAEIYRQLIERVPGNGDLSRLYGLALSQCGRAAEGLPYLEEAVKRGPKQALAHLHHGLVLLALERFADAADAFRRAARLDHRDPVARLNLVNALLRQGEASEALTVADKVISMAPNVPEAWNNHGLALLQLDRYAEARDSFAQAVALRPVFPDAWVSLGRAEKALGHFEQATEACKTALRQQPDCVAAGLNLANLCSERGDTEQAEDLYRQLLAIDGHKAEVRLGLSNVLLERESPDEALALLVGDAPTAKLRGQWRQQRIRALNQLERYEEARAELAAASHREADELGLLNVRLGYALQDDDEKLATNLAERIERRLRTGHGLPFIHRVDAHFGLGQFWHGRNGHERAFAEWSEGHALLSQVEGFSADEYCRFTAAVREAFDVERFARGPRAGNAAPLPVFIVGMPRSGTTLVEQILDCHSRAHGAGELSDMARLFTQWGGAQQSESAVYAVAAQDEAALNEAAASHLGRLRALAPEAERVVDKMPHNFHYLGLIASLFPGARIVHCRRDPRDVALSIYRRRFSARHEYAHCQQDLALALREHAVLMEHWKQVLPLPVHTIDYEALVDDIEGQVRALLDFLGLGFEAACLRFHENARLVQTASRAQVRKPLYQSAVGQWSAYAEQLQPLIQQLAADGLLRGYDVVS